MSSGETAFAEVPEGFYLHNQERGETLHRSDPEAVRREIRALDVFAGARVLEIGTGTGYSGALLAALAGPDGHVVSLDISQDMSDWATRLHHERHVANVTCLVGDGLAGYRPDAAYHRIIGWCTPPRLPAAWTGQLYPAGRIVACLPIAEQPSTTLVATIKDKRGGPCVEALAFGGYAQSTPTAVDDALSVPGRYVDWCTPDPQPSWISLGWRRFDDPDHTGARTALTRLLAPGHTERYDRVPLEWQSFNVYTAALADSRRTVASLRAQARGIGATTTTSAAVILTDGTIIAEHPRSPCLTVLRHWLEQWENAGRPAADACQATLTPYDGPDLVGWNLRIKLPST